jgi:4-hydroxybenzoate polyprenyltransferase/phosphoserine phosphatase
MARCAHPVLFVDLDGSLVTSDLSMESFFRAVKVEPAVLLKAPLWLLRGKAVAKSRVLEVAPAQTSGWSYRAEVIDLLRRLKSEGCHLVLATATNRAIAQPIADDLKLFDDVLASDERHNLKGRNKLRAIEEYCREHDFDRFAYLGDAPADMHIWRKAAAIYAVAPNGLLARRVRALGIPTEIVGTKTGWKDLLKALRPHQWSKNVLIFLPMVLAHLIEPLRVLYCAIAFVAFSACASAVYLVNDLLDLDADRRHPTKSRRPIAAGRVRLPEAAWTAVFLVVFGFMLSFFTANIRFSALLLVYMAASFAYGFWLKRKAVIDVFLLSGLYIIRVQAGGDAAGVPVTEWLLEFSLFFFLSLAFAKRFVELDQLELAADTHDTGRGYRLIDIPTIATLGAASGYIATLVFALYLMSPQVHVLYSRPKVLWLLCPIILFWITRLWLLARRRELHDDPVVFAIKDRMSQALGLLAGAILLVGSLLRSQAQ